MKFKARLKRYLPPVFVEAVNNVVGRNITFTGNYPNWKDALAASTGYDSPEILKRIVSATNKVLAGDAVFERDSVLFHRIEYPFPVLAGLLRAAVENDGNLSVLDFGGALGTLYRQCRPFLKGLKKIEWTVVEQDSFVKVGQTSFSTEELRFAFSPPEPSNELRINVLVLSSVLQYLPNPHSTLASLLRLRPDYVIIDRTPLCDSVTDRLTVQHVPQHIYKASYPCWIMSKSALLSGINQDWIVLVDFVSPEGVRRVNSDTEFYFGGLILSKKESPKQ